MHFSAYAGRSPPRPTNGVHRQSPPPEGLGPIQILLGVLLLLSPPCSPTFHLSTALPQPAPASLGSLESCRWMGGWMDGRTLWPPSPVRHLATGPTQSGRDKTSWGKTPWNSQGLRPCSCLPRCPMLERCDDARRAPSVCTPPWSPRVGPLATTSALHQRWDVGRQRSQGERRPLGRGACPSHRTPQTGDRRAFGSCGSPNALRRGPRIRLVPRRARRPVVEVPPRGLAPPPRIPEWGTHGPGALPSA